MRVVKNLQDVQIVLRDLLNNQATFQTKALNRKGTQVKNMGPGTDPNDAVTVSQLQAAIPNVSNPAQDFTVVFSNAGGPSNGDSFADYIFGQDRIGHPTAVWIRAKTAPTTGIFEVNLTLNGSNLLNSNIQLAMGANGPVFSSNFVSPFPKFGFKAILGGTVVAANSAQIVSVGICVRRDIQLGS